MRAALLETRIFVTAGIEGSRRRTCGFGAWDRDGLCEARDRGNGARIEGYFMLSGGRPRARRGRGRLLLLSAPTERFSFDDAAHSQRGVDVIGT